jgi:subtilisin-like proprotein convertase family protein
VNPTAIAFGGVEVGETSAAQTVTLTNNGSAALTIASITGSGAPFTVNTTGTDLTLDPAQSTTFSVTFAPTTATTSNGTVSIVSDAPGSPHTVTLSGTGTNFTTYPSTGGPVAITDNDPAGITSTIVVPPGAPNIADLDVMFDATHSWTGDIAASVSRGATSVLFLDRAGNPATTFGCSGDNPQFIADDEGTLGALETSCTNTTPSYVPDGRYTPNNPLSVFDGSSAVGTWTLTVSDNAAGDTGTLDAWALLVTPGGVAGEPGPVGAASSLVVAPNPIASSAQATLTVGTATDVRVVLYDALGREVRVLFEGAAAAGQQAYIAFRTDGLAPGAYVLRATGEGLALTQRVTVTR